MRANGTHRKWHRVSQGTAMLLAITSIAGCGSSPGPTAAGTLAANTAATNTSATSGPATEDAATRKEPVVAGRPARVFVFAGLGGACEPLPAPRLTIVAPPARGTIEFRPGQPTSIAASAQGTCAGKSAVGTGVYYTAGPGGPGADGFTIEARLGSGEVMTRTFKVTIVE